MAREILVDRYGRPVPQYLNPANDQYEHLYGSDGALHVKLVSGTELTSSQKEAVARAIDGIIDTIGLENIACFLPMWENTGTELRDLIHPDLRFRVWGATPGVVGPFGSAWAFDGVNDYIEEAPAIETAAGSAEVALDSGTKMLAQRIKFRDPKRPIAFVTLRIRRVGSPVADLSVELREDSGGVPASTAVATSANTFPAGSVSTSYYFVGFAFDPAFSPLFSKTYWIVLKASNVTTLDAANYIAWSYDSAGAYGEPRAVFDGTAWAATSGQSHAFQLYYNHLNLKEGSWIVAVKPQLAAPPAGATVLFQAYGGPATPPSRQISIINLDWAFVSGEAASDKYVYVIRNINLDRYAIAAMTFSKAASTDKLVAYWNGQKVGSASGTSGNESRPPAKPMTLGAVNLHTLFTSYFTGHIGGLIVARVPLTAQQVANITRHLLALRRYKVTGV